MTFTASRGQRPFKRVGALKTEGSHKAGITTKRGKSISVFAVIIFRVQRGSNWQKVGRKEGREKRKIRHTQFGQQRSNIVVDISDVSLCA